MRDFVVGASLKPFKEANWAHPLQGETFTEPLCRQRVAGDVT